MSNEQDWMSYTTSGGNTINMGGAQTDVDYYAPQYAASQMMPQNATPQPWGYGYQQQQRPWWEGVKGISQGPRGSIGHADGHQIPGGGYLGYDGGQIDGEYSGAYFLPGWRTLGEENEIAAQWQGVMANAAHAAGNTSAMLGAQDLGNRLGSGLTLSRFTNPNTLVAPWAQHNYNGPPANNAEAFGLNAQNAAIRGQGGGVEMFDPWADMNYNPGLSGASQGIPQYAQYDQSNRGHGLYGHQTPADAPSPWWYGLRAKDDYSPGLTNAEANSLLPHVPGVGAERAYGWTQFPPRWTYEDDVARQGAQGPINYNPDGGRSNPQWTGSERYYMGGY